MVRAETLLIVVGDGEGNGRGLKFEGAGGEREGESVLCESCREVMVRRIRVEGEG